MFYFQYLHVAKTLTKHHQFGRITVFLSNHVGSNTHVHASITFPGVGNHQLASTDLKMRGEGSGNEKTKGMKKAKQRKRRTVRKMRR